jgi:hypothetical protein
MPVCEEETTRSFFKAPTTIAVGNGVSMLFWLEQWLNELSIEELAPDLVAVVPTRRHNSRTICLALSDNAWLRDIRGPLTIPVLTQYV